MITDKKIQIARVRAELAVIDAEIERHKFWADVFPRKKKEALTECYLKRLEKEAELKALLGDGGEDDEY